MFERKHQRFMHEKFFNRMASNQSLLCFYRLPSALCISSKVVWEVLAPRFLKISSLKAAVPTNPF